LARSGKFKLTETHSHLLEEWDWERNALKPDEVSLGSNKKVWWICSKNPEHKWEAVVFSRSSLESGCPFCAGKKVNHTNCLSTTHPHLLQEWDYEKNTIQPEEITFSSHKIIHWTCKENLEHKWEDSANHRTAKSPRGCPFCAGKQVNHTNCLSTTHPHLLDEWDFERNTIIPEEIIAGTEKKVWWICSKDTEHRWKSRIKTRCERRKGCPYCSNKKINHTNCLSTTHPHLIEEWDYEKNKISPMEISYGSMKKVWWVCSRNKKHGWNGSIKNRTSKFLETGCPYCIHTYSSGHSEVVDFIKENYHGEVKINDRSIIINPRTSRFLELDIYLPENKIAIEFNGDYWHSLPEAKRRDSLKIRLCEQKEIKLIQIEESQWKQNQEQVKKQIINYLL
jgi:hypothetical protein